MAYRTEGFRKAAVQKYLSRGNRSGADVAGELGISTRSLNYWSQRYGTNSGMKKPERRPQDWSAEEKFKAVIEFERLGPDGQGEFLRKQGLHSDHITAWKKSMQAGLESGGGRPASRSERAEARRRIKELERELNRKDKALAETAALLVLKKKADLIWGTGENE